MKMPQVVIDTNVLVAAQRSRQGASSKLLSLIGLDEFQINLSIALVLEYEDVLSRYRSEIGLTSEDIADLIDALCALGNLHDIHFLWRPYLRDPKDEFILELAVAANCEHIIGFNKKDFRGTEKFGIAVVTPAEFLKYIGAI
ncbi:MAG: putative toxin-antitoxin system toxin component, PIN family [Chloroflexota bacterium]